MAMKILIFDIETQLGEAYIWSQKTKFIPITMIKEPTSYLMWAAKWLEDDNIMWSTEWDYGEEASVKALYDLFEEADVIVAHNGDNFDIKWMNLLFLSYGLTPPGSYKTVDTLKVARQYFRFMSNKMDFIGEYLHLGNKIKTNLDLWLDIKAGKKAARRDMVDYCCEDVELLERVYLKFRPWIKNHPNAGMYVDDIGAEMVCPNCGGKHLIKKGKVRLTVGLYQEYKCMDCGARRRGNKKLNPANTPLIR